MDYEMNNEEMGKEMEYEEEQYVPLNWDKLSSNAEVWAVMKEEMDKKFEAECLMKIITAAKEQGMKDNSIFMPAPKIEMVSLFADSVGNSIED